MKPTDDSPPLPPRRHSNRSRNNDSRYFQVADEGWYLRTREGTQGPFESREQAERFLAELIRAQTRRHTPAR
ncbi:MAG: DUF6316 family protein [Gammaproteobacteria bacterium]